MPCSGAEAENCSNRACIQEGEGADPFLLLLFSSPILAVMMLYIVHSNIRGDVTRN